MLKENMYVRLPADYEDEENPRIFICGQIKSIDRIAETAVVQIKDPFNHIQFFPNLPNGRMVLGLSDLVHCEAFVNSRVNYRDKTCKVISVKRNEQGYYLYIVQDIITKSIFQTSEENLIIPFNNGRISPKKQLKQYELQNPQWYVGRCIVSKNVTLLENSIAGFEELAGCKIYLYPHQVNTIMRCLQSDVCRYMLADEVGMGKTIEALSVYKLYTSAKSGSNALIIVPKHLKEQWKVEMIIKFNLSIGTDNSNNKLQIKSFDEVNSWDVTTNWDFVIVDEAHNCLRDQELYNKIHRISQNSESLLLLSATPIQQREEEYLNLIRLLEPQKYDQYSLESFKELVTKQRKIIEQSTIILNDLDEYNETIEETLDDGDDPSESEDCMDYFDDIKDSIESLCKIFKDPKLIESFKEIDFESEDYGITQMKTVISYICSNYQIENGIIRNRKSMRDMELDKETNRILIELDYDLNLDLNTSESAVYNEILDYMSTKLNDHNVETFFKPLLEYYFSSPWALYKAITEQNVSLPLSLKQNIRNWVSTENYYLEHLQDILDDPDSYEKAYTSRIIKIINFLYEEIESEKVVLFANKEETIKVYYNALNTVFGQEKVALFSKNQAAESNELAVYRFQNDKNCQFLLCDESGGEGRNFQCADYIVHIDLPWNANIIEQRIGRLDRLGRDKTRPNIYSVVVHTNDSIEHDLFRFWNEGTNIFTEYLSGLEIFMEDLNKEIINSIYRDYKYGLSENIPVIKEKLENLKVQIRKEKMFDTISVLYGPMFIELKKLIDYYSNNENSIFADAMTHWASMAGFKGNSFHDKITYDPHSFSLKSAFNSLFIPPNWKEYENKSQANFIIKANALYTRKKKFEAIRGTFNRKLAIENDYLHFFAPGNAMYDSIIDNAIKTCKGQSSAFAIQSKYDWKGFIFTFKLVMDESSLLKKGKSLYSVSNFRNFICNDLISIPIAIQNDDDITDQKIMSEYNSIINNSFKNRFINLGKRARSAGFLKDIIEGANVDWFKSQYSEDQWSALVEDSYTQASAKAKQEYNNRSDVKGLNAEIQRQLSARQANVGYYGIDDNSVEELKDQLRDVIKTFNNTKIILDSACYIWMVKNNE